MWTVYGVLKGGETVRRYRRISDAQEGDLDLETVGDHEVSPGYIDFVPPGEIHAEYNGPSRTVGIILRSGNVGTNPQTWYYPGDRRTAAAVRPEADSLRARLKERDTPRRWQSRVAQRVAQCEIWRSGARGRPPEPILFRRGTTWRKTGFG